MSFDIFQGTQLRIYHDTQKEFSSLLERDLDINLPIMVEQTVRNVKGQL